MVKEKKSKNKSPLLDLHGEQLLHIEDKVDRFIVQAQKKGLSEIRIMTGKGTGKVLSAVQNYLKLGGYPFHFEKSSDNKINEGVLIIHV